MGYFTLSEKGLILEANVTGAVLLGVGRNDLVNQPLTRFILSEDQDIYYRHRKQLFATRSPQVCELRLAKKDATTLWARLDAAVTQDDERDAPVYRVVVSDISERKRNEEALREAQERMALAANAAHIGIYDWNLLKGELVCTQQCEVIFGESPTTFTTTHPYKNWADRVHPDDLARVEDRMRRCIAERTPIQVQYRIVWPDKSLHWVEGKGRTYYDAEGRATRMLGTIMDISERKRAEEALRESERFVQGILRGTPNLIYVYDLLERRNIYANRSTLDFLGYTPKEIQTMGVALFRNILHPDDADSVAQHHVAVCRDWR